MQYTVHLKPFQDDATGAWGLTHKETFDADYPFNAFWDASGVMHDVFEHWFEGILPPFRGNNMCNVYGEMVATGIRVYMRCMIGFDIFSLRNRTFGPSDPMLRADTEFTLKEYITDNYSSFPVHYIPIPKQDSFISTVDAYNLDTTIEDYWSVLTEEYPLRMLYGKQISKSAIRDAYYYGYRLAKRMYGKYDRGVVYEFLEAFQKRWHTTTNTNTADSLYIADSGFGLKYIRFDIHNKKKNTPTLITTLIDDVGNEYPFDALS